MCLIIAFVMKRFGLSALVFQLSLLPVFWACNDVKPVRQDPATTGHSFRNIAFLNFAGLDLLLVIDSSASMAGEQEVLKMNLEAIIENLLDSQPSNVYGPDEEWFRYHRPVRDLHVGIVSTDLGTAGHEVPGCPDPAGDGDGILLGGPQCPDNPSGILEYRDFETDNGPCLSYEEREAIDDARLAQVTSGLLCTEGLGAGGCGFEQPLEAALRALTIQTLPGGPNEGFLREQAMLLILFITDEDDCSVDLSYPGSASIFDAPAPSGEPDFFQCYRHPEMLYPVERYVEKFNNIKGRPWQFMIGLVIGVPPDRPECLGAESDLDACLASGAMQVSQDPDQPDRPLLSCESASTGASAYPPRRLVEFAREMAEAGESEDVAVASICGRDFLPVIAPLARKLSEVLDYLSYHYSIEILKDDSDPRGCTCKASCRAFLEMPDGVPCPSPAVPFYDRDMNGDGLLDERDAFKVDWYDGGIHAVCEIPQKPTLVTGCPCCTSPEEGECRCDLACDNVEARLIQPVCEPGWWYLPYFEAEDMDPSPYKQEISVSPDLRGSNTGVSLECTDHVCPPPRACGRLHESDFKCCDASEYCWNETCLVRQDVCEELGGDLWCPAEDMPDGAVCCLDPDGDGLLDMEDRDGDGIPETPSLVCDGLTCVPRP
jgi:hypothetical protein